MKRNRMIKMMIILELLFLIVKIQVGECFFNEQISSCFGESVTNDIHISYLSLIDSDTKNSTFMSREASLLDSTFKNALLEVSTGLITNIKINDSNHLLNDIDSNKIKLINILTNPALAFQNKIWTIQDELNIDPIIKAVLLGEYREFRTHFEVFLYWILFHNNSYVVEKIILHKEDCFFKDQSQQIIISEKFKSYFQPMIIGLVIKSCPALSTLVIPRSVVKMLDEVLKKRKKIIGNPYYLSNISFFYVDRESLEIETSLNKAVEKGIEMAQKKYPYFKYNETGHTFQNNELNIRKVYDIVTIKQNSKAEKMDKLVNIMNSANIDSILFGYIIENLSKIEVSPVIVCKKEKKIIVKNVVFEKSEFMRHKNTINSVIFETIADQISELLFEL